MGAISVREVIDMPIMRRALPEILAGADRLDVGIRWVHVIDAQRPQGLLKGGELVLTTGVGLPRDDAEAHRRFVRDLCEQGVAAVAGPGAKFGTAIPEAMIDEARRFDLPLVALNRFVRFVEITEAVHGEIMARELALLRETDRFLRRLTALVYDGGDIPALLHEVATTVQAPVALESLDHRIVSHDSAGLDDDVVMSMWRHHRMSEDFEGGPAPGVHIVPVRVPGGPWGRLVCFEVDAPLPDTARRVIEHAADVLGFALGGQGESEYVSRSTGSFLHELAAGRLDDASARARVGGLGFAGEGLLLPFIASWRAAPTTRLAPDRAWTALIRRLKRTFADERLPLLVGPWEGSIVGIVALGAREADTPTLDRVAETVHAARRQERIGEEEIALSIGPPSKSWVDLGSTLEVLAVAGGAAATQPVQPWHDARRMSVPTLLYGLLGNPTLQAFVQQQLGDLLNGNNRRNREMIETIRELAVNGGRKADAARSLHLTRQSLYYRIERIEEALGVDLDSGETLLALHLAITALPMLNQRNAFLAGR
ncbi:MAG TPA: PucR family transcriptional regulator [Capillimicrobium sp.]|nr:PucR family transcriptional regulator [Capillimicrobium sp.]